VTQTYFVDSGKHECGFAAFWDQHLTAARLIDSCVPLKQDFISMPEPPHVYCEIPQVYAFGKGKGDPDDLIALALAAGTVTAGLPRTFLKPAQWKGQIPEDVLNSKMFAALHPAELAILEACTASRAKKKPKGRGHMQDVYVAVQMGLKHFGRI
jgi:hypothetical protein